MKFTLKIKEGKETVYFRFMHFTSGISELAVARGYLFEQRLAHDLLQAGGKFYVTEFRNFIKHKNERDILPGRYLEVPRCNESLSIGTPEDIQSLPLTVYGRPNSQNFAGIDSVLTPNCLFQITSGESHSINANAVVEVVEALRAGRVKRGKEAEAEDKTEEFLFLFVVPQQQYSTFRVGKVDGTAENIAIFSQLPLRVFVLQCYNPRGEEESAESADGKRKADVTPAPFCSPTSFSPVPAADVNLKRPKLSVPSTFVPIYFFCCHYRVKEREAED